MDKQVKEWMGKEELHPVLKGQALQLINPVQHFPVELLLWRWLCNCAVRSVVALHGDGDLVCANNETKELNFNFVLF